MASSDPSQTNDRSQIRALVNRFSPSMITTEKCPESLDEYSDEKFTYKMDHPRRGIALIINNVIFQNGMPERQGSDRDAESMKTVLKDLRFNVIMRRDQNVRSMKQLFKDMGSTDQSNNDCFVCVILSHGEDDDVIFATDGKIKLETLVEPILPEKCPSLSGKPKLFFIQACRGTKMDKGKEMADSIDKFSIGEGFHSYKSTRCPKIPIWADVLIAYSTIRGYYSWRNSVNGSWFIQSLSYVLKNEATQKEIVEILTKVNYKVALEYESKTDFPKNDRMKQVPCITSMLTKQLYF